VGDRLELGPLHHVGMVVPDCEAAVARYGRELGLGSLHRFDGRYPARVGGTDVVIDVTGAFVRLGTTLLELLEPRDDRSPHAVWLAAHPGGGLHHLAYVVDSLDGVRARVHHGKLSLLIDAAVPGDPSNWVYVEEPAGGLVLELVERGAGSDAFFAAVERGLRAG
jgi:methylmalonyl-CoA/ethylmalonyl-CoA epimerase